MPPSQRILSNPTGTLNCHMPLPIAETILHENRSTGASQSESSMNTHMKASTLASAALVLSEVFPPQKGGSGRWLWEIYGRLPEQHFQMVVGQTNQPHAADDAYSQAIHRVDLSMAFRGVANFNSIRRYVSIIRTVRKLALQNRVSELHASRPLFEGLVARSVKLLTGIPYLCFIHGEDVNVAMTSRELRLLTSSVLKNASKLIANSTFTQKLLIDDWNIEASKIQLLHPGVDCEYYQPASNDLSRPDRWRDRLVLLTVGRLQERKGHDAVIHSLPQIVKRFPNVLYAIAGDGERRATLEQLTRKLGMTKHVQFMGEIDDDALRTSYQNCDVFVMANRAVGRDVEGFGMVFLEAQACGKPVVAGNSGGTLDTLLSGKTGFLVSCENADQPEELVAVLTRLLEDPAERIRFGNCGREFVSGTFDWPRLAIRAERILALSH